jgi:hypothetical protein
MDALIPHATVAVVSAVDERAAAEADVRAELRELLPVDVVFRNAALLVRCGESWRHAVDVPFTG